MQRKSEMTTTKQRRAEVVGDGDGVVAEIGAVQVNERAPDLNRRFFIGITRPSRRRRERERRRRRREEAGGGAEGERGVTAAMEADAARNVEVEGGDGDDDSEGGGRLRRSSQIARVWMSFTNGANAVIATLVEDHSDEDDDDGEVFVAERVSALELRGKQFAIAFFFLLMATVVAVPFLIDWALDEREGAPDAPTISPTLSPTHDSRPTLEIVQERGIVRCKLPRSAVDSEEWFHHDHDLCRAIASVVIGDPKGYVVVPNTKSDRFQRLYDRSADVMLGSVTHTIEREVREDTTGRGFTFSSPYYYDGMVYVGSKALIDCAERQKRYDECSSLRICVAPGTTHLDFIRSSFPSDFFVISSDHDVMREMLQNGTCNVGTYDQLHIIREIGKEAYRDSNLTKGNKLNTKEPLSIVTRKHDREFSDIINWVVQSLFYGEERGLSKNMSLCQNYTTIGGQIDIAASDLNFLNAVHCVGNYGEVMFNNRWKDTTRRMALYEGKASRGMNQINNGTTGMLYATPFGIFDLGAGSTSATSSLLDKIKNRGSLNCGVVVPDGFEGEITESDEVLGFSVDYCRTLAASILRGDSNKANLTAFAEYNATDAFVALNNRTIDVLAGVMIEKKYDFATSSLPGFQFSTPYYYGNEAASRDMSAFALATLEDDATFSSFVNCVVLSTFFALEKGIKRETHNNMPLLLWFGDGFSWALRDAIYYSGNYKELYEKNFSPVDTGWPIAMNATDTCSVLDMMAEPGNCRDHSVSSDGENNFIDALEGTIASIMKGGFSHDLLREGSLNGRNSMNEFDTPQIHSFPGIN